MLIEQERLSSLIEFAQQSARLRAKLVSDVKQHNIFHEYERDIANLPGLDFNGIDDNKDVWLAIQRLQESPAPYPASNLLRIWIDVTNNPANVPELRTHVTAKTLLEIGAIAALETEVNFDPEQLISIDTYEQKSTVEDELKSYIENIWKPWALEEKRRRRSISLYAKLFTLKQQLEGGIVDNQVELTWGAGIAVWNLSGTQLTYPLLTQQVELLLNETTMAIEIRPRDIEPKLELDFFSATDNPGVSALDKISKDFFSDTSVTFSPLDYSSFEPLIRSAVIHLDPSGVFWPNQTTADDRTIPQPGEKLTVTNTWVLFARPRSASLFIQDLERFKQQIENQDTLPKAVMALVTDPSTTNPEISLPAFRGISMIHGSGHSKSSAAQELFFPDAFNDEQVQIVQKLQVYDGVVVQGPPGTGKTHTIANIICHYLALGQRVLVTSMKEPALNVLREKLPDRIQPLAISLLTTEQEGMKQFEHSVSKIASEVQVIDRVALSREIAQIEANIDNCHAKLAKTDSQINDWAIKNLSNINLDGEQIEPREAAAEVANNRETVVRLDDAISIGAEFQPRFTDTDIIKLRESRRALDQDIDYLNCNLPMISAFPDSRELLHTHQDLSRYTELQSEIDSGGVPSLANSSKATFEAAQLLSEQISNLKRLRQSIRNANLDWTEVMLIRLRSNRENEVLQLFNALSIEFDTAFAERTQFLAKPVEPSEGIDDLNDILISAIRRCAEGKRPFGINGIIGKNNEKQYLKAIRISGSLPANQDDWQHILAFASHRRSIRTLLTRWNSLASELRLPAIAVEPTQVAVVIDQFNLYRKLDEVVTLEHEIAANVKEVCPSWSQEDISHNHDEALNKLQKILHHHLTQHRLSDTWAIKERFQQILSGCSGRITIEIKKLVDQTLGNPVVNDASLQEQWSTLMEELRRVQGLNQHLGTVESVIQLIIESGAPRWANRLRSEAVTSTTDTLLPDNWRKLWRINRLANYLEAIDGRAELKRLVKLRANIENDLARSYQDAVAKRTWLKLAENATPSVKAALQAYLAAIMKMGKRKGKRVPLYQRQARDAAAMATPAIPCWIMPHYRVSESLPAEFGCFDLVIIDEASQSDLSALPAIFRAKKVLVVGDDKQVSPDGSFMDTQAIQNLVNRYLLDQFPLYRDQMTPDRSIYDLFKVVFADSATMLKEHFRCVAPIIEYSKREVYKHELKPLRIPKASERLDPPLIDVIIEDGFRKGDINLGEALYIVNEIKSIIQDPRMMKRSIGVVSLLGDKQALKIWEMLNADDLDEEGLPVGLPPDIIDRHKITCGDARTFQGKERDIMFLSMVVSKGNASALARDAFVQRFNVAASRARDRMYLVRSITTDNLSNADSLRRNLIAHFAAPFAQDEIRVENHRELCESDFEREVYNLLTERGYRVIPQVKFGGKTNGSHEFRIDMVVEGHQDNRLAIECDGDRYHGPDCWDDDMRRQRILERAGWRFWRCFASTFVMRREEVIDDLLKTLNEMGIEPIGTEGASCSLHSQQRLYTAFPMNLIDSFSPELGEISRLNNE